LSLQPSALVKAEVWNLCATSGK